MGQEGPGQPGPSSCPQSKSPVVGVRNCGVNAGVSSSPSQPRGGYLDRPHSSSLADVLNVILDKGLVIDAYVRVSLLGVELVAVDARIVVASVDTYLRFAEATSRLDLSGQSAALPDMVQSGVENLVENVAKERTLEAIEHPIRTFFGKND